MFKKCGGDTLVRLLMIRPEDTGVSSCGGKVGKTGLHACTVSLTFGASYGSKAHSVKAQDKCVDTLYIQTPSKTSMGQKMIYMAPFLPIEDIDQVMIVPLHDTERTVDVWSSLLPSLVSLFLMGVLPWFRLLI